jgi:hypothetical protein
MDQLSNGHDEGVKRFCFWGVWHCVLVWGVIVYCNVGQCLNCIDLLCGLLSAKGKEFGVNTFSVVLILLFDACEICGENCIAGRSA